MISFPNAKINLGLKILNKREDGYHNIKTLFYPLPFHDILEIVPSSEETKLKVLGNKLDSSMKNNLVYKAWKILHERYDCPNVKINLYKKIPSGAGLGGGSSDASSCLLNLNKQFDLGLSENQLLKIASEIGSDCPFFILNKPVFAKGRGEIMTETAISLKGKYLILIVPDIHISTALAYKNTKISGKDVEFENNFNNKPGNWRNKIINDFESYAFDIYAELKLIKQMLYNIGAEFALMSGSGSSLYGIFDKKPEFSKELNKYENHIIEL